MRSSLIAALVLVFASAPAAHAAVADNYLPVYGAGSGVSVKLGQTAQLRFRAKADKVYRGIRGRRAMTVCAGISQELAVDSRVIAGPVKLPRARTPVKLLLANPDVCALATAQPNSVDLDECQPLTTELPGWCTRAIVAVTDRGRAYLDQLQRTYELFYTDALAVAQPAEFGVSSLEWLQGALGNVVALPAADGSPTAGNVGFWQQGTSHAVVVLLRDGKRRFLRRDGDVVSTNDPHLLGRGLTVL